MMKEMEQESSINVSKLWNKYTKLNTKSINDTLRTIRGDIQKRRRQMVSRTTLEVAY